MKSKDILEKLKKHLDQLIWQWEFEEEETGVLILKSLKKYIENLESK